jgi:hypothetical protein
MALGTVISLPFSGILAAVGGWESVFYVQGGLALIWSVLWILFVYDSPEEHPRIHSEELKLFKIYRGNNQSESPDASPEPIMETKLESEETHSEVLSSENSAVKNQKNKKVKRIFLNIVIRKYILIYIR